MRLRNKLAYSLVITLMSVMFTISAVHAGPREQAKRMHDRLVGVPPSSAVLDSMTTKIQNGDTVGAAYEAMENPAFYTTTLKDFSTPWTNRDASVYEDLNDFSATVIGMIRDEVPFNQVLSGDIVYIGSAAATNNVAYSQTDNDHYLELQDGNVNLGDPNNLIQTQQSALPGNILPASATAGVMTTRSFAQSFLVAGTNRAAFRFTSVNFLCKDLEDLRDATARPNFIRQDVTRSPGGDSSIFFAECLTCHAGMDALAGAFAYYDFDEETMQIAYTAGVVQPKYLQGAGTFRFGHETTYDGWVNYWRTGPNASMGWGGPAGSGVGAKSLGVELASTRQFAACQVKKAFEKVCYRPPNGQADHTLVENVATTFQNNNYSMKRVFADTAAYCMGN
jgi:hypothetical protein